MSSAAAVSRNGSTPPAMAAICAASLCTESGLTSDTAEPAYPAAIDLPDIAFDLTIGFFTVLAQRSGICTTWSDSRDSMLRAIIRRVRSWISRICAMLRCTR